ncbi:MAG: gliding motility-associated C-terminal domain-containing protein [Sphingobacteriales bacterium]|nr:gliding motility-associated C-terminal domain-containing protein [Sphingobacteriales bacterium]
MKNLPILLLCLFFTLKIYAQSGNTCADAIPITLPLINNNFTTCNSQNNFNAPSPGSCFLPSETVNQYASGPDMFFYFVPTVSACYNIIPYTASASTNASVFVYEGCPEEFNCVGGSVFFLDGLFLTAGHTYTIIVSNKTELGGNNCIDFQLYITNPDDAPDNDICAGIAPIAGYANNFNASSCGEPNSWSPELNGIDCAGGDWTSNENGMWYQFNNPSTQNVDITAYNINCTGINGNDNTLQMGVWTNTGTCDLSQETFVTCLVAVGTGTVSMPNLTAGNYYLFIDGNAASLCSWSFYSPNICIPPAVTFNTINPDCNTNNGAIQAVIQPNPPPNGVSYSVLWNTGSTNNVINNLGPGSYTVTVTSNSVGQSCATVATVTLQSTNIQASATNTGPVCINEPVFLSATGGVSYSWAGSGITAANQNTTNPNVALTAGGVETYTVTITDALGCTTTASTTIGIVSFPVQIDAPSIACLNQNVDLTALGGTSYLWSNPSGSIVSNQATLSISTVTPQSAGTYAVTVTGIAGCTNTATTTLNLGQATATIIAPNSFCFNDTLHLTATGGSSYLWSGPAGFSSTLPNPIIYNTTQFDAGTYGVTVTGTGGCTAMAEQIISLSNVNATASNSSPVCEPNSFQLFATGGVSYAWSDTHGYTSSDQNPIITDTYMNLSDFYTVTVTNANGCTRTASTMVTVNGINAIVTNNSPVCTGQTVQLSANNGVSYSWSGANGFVSNLPNPTINNATIANAGTYTVTITGINGCSTTQTTTVVISQPNITLTANNNTLCVGKNLSITASGGQSYNWTLPNNTTYNQDNLTINNVLLTDAGVYNVTATDSIGCTATESIIINVTNFATTATNNSPLCIENTLQLNATGGVLYSWQGANNFTSTEQNPIINAANTANAGTYTVTVTNSNGCITSTTTTVTINQAVASASTINPACFGNDLLLTANGGVSYSWAGSNGFSSAQQNPIISNTTALQTGTYTVTVTNANSCTATASTTANIPALLQATIVSQNVNCFSANNGQATANANGGTGSVAFLWSEGSTTNSINQLLPNTYTLTVTDANGCTTSTQTQITQPAPININISPTNATCFGNTGSLSVTSTNGVSPYVYAWNNSLPPDSVLQNIAPNNYTLTVTDANGCTQTAQTQITQPSPIAITANTTNVLCFGELTGQIAANATGGTGVFSYQWSNGGSISSALNNIAAGAYTLTVTDTNQCTQTATYNITQNTPLQGNIFADEVLCFGGTTNLFATALGSTMPYSFVWSDTTQTLPSLLNVTAGTYTVTITDANQCNTTNQITVTQPTALNLVPTNTNVACFGTSTGSISANATNGTPPYSYTWSNTPQNINSQNNLSIGTYSITVTDANNCSIAQNIAINQPDSLNITANVLPAICYQTQTGAINTNVSGGSIPYTYTWSNNANTPNLINVLADTYTLTVSDVVGCTKSISLTITQPDTLIITTSPTDIVCNGQQTGSIATTTIGGTTPYFYTWSNNLPPTPNQTNSLLPNTYTVTVTDLNGCTSTSSANINQPTPIAITVSTTNANCGQANGSATLNVSGGTGSNYTYTWQDNLSTTNTCSNLLANVYNVTVTDEVACTQTISVAITNNNAPQITDTTLVNTTCTQANGSISLTVTAIGAVDYVWSANTNAGNTPTVSNLLADTYAVTITDQNNCNAIAVFTLTNAPSPQLTIQSQNNTTCGFNNGQITANATGGTGTLTYQWSNGGSSSSAQNNLAAGTYTLTVTDINQCTDTISSTIQSSVAPTIDLLSLVNTSCNQANGSITVSAQNTIGAITYVWADAVSNSSTASNLNAGTYTLTITDQNQCTILQNFVIVAEPAPSLSITNAQNPTCEQANGSLTATVQNAIGAVSYQWNIANANTQTINNLPEGTYTVTITDQLSCTASALASISNQQSPQIVNNTISPDNCNQQNGTVQINAIGGTGALVFVWSDAVSNTSTATNLSSGSYTVTVTDQNQCFDSLTVFIPQTSSPQISNTQTTNANCNQSDGSISITATGGTGNLSYTWSNTPANTPNLTNLTTGNYTVTITDEVQCSTTQTIAVLNNDAPTIQSIDTTPSTCNNNNGTAQINLTGGTGTLSYVWTDAVSTTNSATNLSAQNYTVTITDQSQCSAIATFTINNQAAPQVIDTQITNASCGNNNGTISITTTGGTGNLVYTWTDLVSNTNIANNLSPQTYTVTITDQNACSTTTTAVIVNQNAPNITDTQITNATCGNANGSATITVTGGSPPISYTWTDAVSTTNTANNLSAQTYTITITDSNQCSNIVNVVVDDTPSPQIDSLQLTPTTCGSANGSITIWASNGTGALSYFWADAVSGITDNVANNLSAGTYSVTITDQNACSTNTTAIIVNQNAPNITNTQITNATCGNANGSATITVTGGTPPISYTWTDAVSTTNTANNLSAQTYTITVTDSNQCSNIVNVVVDDTPLPQIDSLQLTPTTCGSANGSITIWASNGTGALSYIWADAVSSVASAQNLNAGTYSVTITDANNCSINTTATIAQQDAPTLSVLFATPTNCNTSNGQIDMQVTGGTSPFVYTWTDAVSNTNTATNLAAGTYTLTVTDANNCTATQTANVQATLLAPQAQCSTPTDSTITVTWQTVLGVDEYIVIANGQTDTLSVTTLNYTIGNLPADTTIQILVLANGCGITQTDTLSCQTLDMPPCLPVSLQITTPDSLFCEADDALLLTALPTNGVFSGNGVADNTFYPSQANIGDNILTYTYTAPDNCIYTSTQTMMVYPTPNASFIGDTIVCINQPSLFTFNGIAPQNSTYQWLINSTVVGNDANLQTTFTDTSTNQISLIVTTQYGCTDTISQPLQIATLTASTIGDTTVLFGSSIFLPTTALSNLDAPLSYTWQSATSELSCYNCDNPQTTITQPINTYTLLVTDSYGCLATDQVNIAVMYNNAIIIPSAFSPNNDLQNDTFGILGHNIAQYELMIYNRWGNKVFSYSGTNTNQYWDGTINGIECEVGVYVYYANIIFTNGQQTIKKGNVTLIR